MQIAQIHPDGLSVLIHSSGKSNSFMVQIDFNVDCVTQVELPSLDLIKIVTTFGWELKVASWWFHENADTCEAPTWSIA